jgi:ribosome biogenesis protein Nip4
MEHMEWFLNSVCSRHMTLDDSLFSNITKINGGKVIFRDNSKGKIIGVDNIRGKLSPLIKKAFLVNSLKHSFLRISQLCNKGYKIIC